MSSSLMAAGAGAAAVKRLSLPVLQPAEHAPWSPVARRASVDVADSPGADWMGLHGFSAALPEIT
ncbi:hypothetical protein [uncultured Roseobacter sp.]|uniref:hypothetical protein n=1 Tax=uncultured Roseobacter sp. TaxID=114847 RepID=UPI00260F0283|nr:hypothetical protein [uncultured Roseobacter sp.]